MWSGFFLFVNLSSQATLNLFKSSQIFIEVPDHTKAAKFLRKRALKPWRFHSSHPEKFPQHMEHQKNGTWFCVRNEICARKRPRSDLSVNPRKKNTFSRRFVRTSGNLWILLVFWVFFVGPLPGCQWPPGLQLNLYLPLHFLGICVDRVFVGQVWPPLASALLSCRTVGTRDATSIPDSQPNRVKGGKTLGVLQDGFATRKNPRFWRLSFRRKFRSKKVGCQPVAFVTLMCLLVGKNGCFAQTWIMHQKKGKTRFFHPTRMQRCNSNNKISSVSVGVGMSPREPAIFLCVLTGNI